MSLLLLRMVMVIEGWGGLLFAIDSFSLRGLDES